MARSKFPTLVHSNGDAGDSEPSATPSTSDELPSVLTHPRLSPKIREFCRVAREAGYDLVWQDACCIDKSSSAELSEAIRSMFEWYRRASICYVYLADVPDGDNPMDHQSWFARSRWHKRGWTLQELVAPRRLAFLTKRWKFLGSKLGLGKTLEKITGIELGILAGTMSLDSASVARRMSWASERRTTRVEDRAYSLMGIFGVHLPVMYGEGQNAFLRLQEEIVRQIPDQSIFAWGRPRNALVKLSGRNTRLEAPVSTQAGTVGQALLAPDPSYFTDEAGSVSPLSRAQFARRLGFNESESALKLPPLHCVFTPEGIRVELLCLDPAVLSKSSKILCVAHKPPLTWGSVDSLSPCNDPNCQRLGHSHLLALLRCQDHEGSIVALPLLTQAARTVVLAAFRSQSPTPLAVPALMAFRSHPIGWCIYRTVSISRCWSTEDQREQGAASFPDARVLQLKELLIHAQDAVTLPDSADTEDTGRPPVDIGKDWYDRHSPWTVIHPANPPVVIITPHCTEELRALGLAASSPTIQVLRSAASEAAHRPRGIICRITTNLQPSGKDRGAWSIGLQLTIPYPSPSNDVPLRLPPNLTYKYYAPAGRTAHIPLPNGKPLTFSRNRPGSFPCSWWSTVHHNFDRSSKGLEQPLFIPLDPDWELRSQDTGVNAQLLSFSYEEIRFTQGRQRPAQLLLSFELSERFRYKGPILLSGVGNSRYGDE